MKKIEKSVDIGGRKLTLSTGHLAGQAGGAVLATYGETVVLSTVTSQPLDRELDYFPLTVEYQEKLYAGGRIKGSRWVKRDGRPTDNEILVARLIDRSIRPLFPKTYKNDVQVINTVLSVDLENSPEIVAAIATTAAVAISNVPWGGPIGVVKVGMKDGKFVANPTQKDLLESKMDLVVSTTDKAIVMVEAGSREVTEDEMVGGIEYAFSEGKKIIELVSELAREVGKKKDKVEEIKVDLNLEKKIQK